MHEGRGQHTQADLLFVLYCKQSVVRQMSNELQLSGCLFLLQKHKQWHHRKTIGKSPVNTLALITFLDLSPANHLSLPLYLMWLMQEEPFWISYG